ncbi:MAG: hypothetical protein ACOCXA_06985, partial [Planctomycetota bacterium]
RRQQQQRDQQFSRRQQQQRDQQSSRRQQQQRDQQFSRRQQQQDQSQQQQATFSGILDGFNKVQLKNAPEENVFVRLRLQNGSSRIVDLGDISSVKALQLNRGDQVTIKGKKRNLNGKPVLEARSLKIDKQHSDDTDRYVRSGNQGLPDQESVMFQGTVEGLKKTQVKGQQDKVTVMKLKLKDGKNRLLNISPWMAKQFLDIDQGDEVVVSGQRQQTKSGKNVVIIDGILVLEDEPTVSAR